MLLENLEERLLLDARVIEDFGSGTLDAYTTIYRYRPSAEVVPGAAHDGKGNALVKHDGFEWMVRDDDAVQVHQGETLSVWTKFADNVDGRIYFGFGATPNGTYHSPLYVGGTLALVLAGNTGQFMFMSDDRYTPQFPADYGFKRAPVVIGQPVAQDYTADQWYRMEVVWGTDNSLTGNLYDDQDNLLNTVTASDVVITDGGIAFRGFGSDKYFDTVTVDDGSGNKGLRPVRYATPPASPRSPAPPGPGPGVTAWDGGTGTVLPFAYTPTDGTGRDIALETFDQLQQYNGVFGGMVGLAAENYSLNVGSVQVSWGPDPQDGAIIRDVPQETPLLAQYLFRQRPGEPTTLIGSSDVKQFFSSAKADYEFLNPGEEDDYISALNGDQTRYLPGADLDPATGEIHRPSYYSTVNLDGFDAYQRPTYANKIEHLLKVNVADLDPAQNPDGTRWFLAGNLWVAGDEDVSDNSRWVEITPVWNPATQRFTFQYPNGATGQYDFTTIPGLSTAPYLVRATPAGEILTDPVDTVTVTFDRPIDPATFTPDQVQFTGPDGDIPVDAITPADDSGTRFWITFTPQGDSGSYSLVLGTGIADLNGTPLDVARTINFDIQSDGGAPGSSPGRRGALGAEVARAFTPSARPSVTLSDLPTARQGGAVGRPDQPVAETPRPPEPAAATPPRPRPLPDPTLSDAAFAMPDALLLEP